MVRDCGDRITSSQSSWRRVHVIESEATPSSLLRSPTVLFLMTSEAFQYGPRSLLQSGTAAYIPSSHYLQVSISTRPSDIMATISTTTSLHSSSHTRRTPTNTSYIDLRLLLDQERYLTRNSAQVVLGFVLYKWARLSWRMLHKRDIVKGEAVLSPVGA